MNKNFKKKIIFRPYQANVRQLLEVCAHFGKHDVPRVLDPLGDVFDAWVLNFSTCLSKLPNGGC